MISQLFSEKRETRIKKKFFQCILGMFFLLTAIVASLVGQQKESEETQTKKMEQDIPIADEMNTDEIITDNGVEENESMEYIRVEILNDNYEGEYHDSVTLSCNTTWKFLYGAGIQEEIAAGELVTITPESSCFSQEADVDRVYILPDTPDGKISLHSVIRSQGTPAYGGKMELLRTDEGLVIINEILLEEYLCAVVPSEMPAGYPLEALKAQAICARTYAYLHMLTPGLAEIGAHVNDSTGYQVYNNVKEQTATTMAVKETAGQILFVGDIPADTYYYSTSCGFGTDEHVWHTQYEREVSYLTAKPISLQRTESVYTAENMCEEAVFSEFIQNRSKDAFEKDEPWYRWKYEVSEVDADILLVNLQTRYAVNPALVLMLKDGEYQSCMPEKLGMIKNIEIIKRNAGGAADELLIEGSLATYKVISELYIRYVLCDRKTQVCRQDGSQVDMTSLLPSGFFILQLEKDGEEITGYALTGGGFGHGAGMSQNGAKNMALSGYSAAQILEFFFTDSEIRKVTENDT